MKLKSGKENSVVTARKPTELLVDYSPHIAILLLAVFCAVKYPLFLRNSLTALPGWTAAYIIAALGMGIVMRVGEIDLSAGRITGFAAILAATLLSQPDFYNWRSSFFAPPHPIWAIIILVMLFGALAGLINGFAVTKLKVPSFLSTLSMQIILYGSILIYLDTPAFAERSNVSRSPLAENYREFVTHTTKIGGLNIPNYVWYAIGIAIIMFIVWNFTKFGKNIRLVGENREAAKASGVKVPLTVTGAFVIAGLLFGIGGFITAARVGGSGAGIGTGMEIDAIGACLLGGFSLKGKRGGVGGIVLGVVFYQLMCFCLQWLAVSGNWVYIIKGAVLVLAAAISINRDSRTGERSASLA